MNPLRFITQWTAAKKTQNQARRWGWRGCFTKATRPLALTSRLLSEQVALPALLTCEDMTSICTPCRTDDLFQQLESRSLTEQEEAIIQQRVCLPSQSPAQNHNPVSSQRLTTILSVVQLELQRKMLKAYEAREKTRKVHKQTLHHLLCTTQAELSSQAAG